MRPDRSFLGFSEPDPPPPAPPREAPAAPSRATTPVEPNATQFWEQMRARALELCRERPRTNRELSKALGLSDSQARNLAARLRVLGFLRTEGKHGARAYATIDRGAV